MEQENHIGDRIGVKDADRALATDASSSRGGLGDGRSSATGGPPTLSTRPTVTSSEGGDGGGGAAASLHEHEGSLHTDSTEPTPVAPVVRVTQPLAQAAPAIAAPAIAVPAIAALASLEEDDEDEEDAPKGASKKKGTKAGTGRGPHINNVRKLRIERMMSKAELARRANLSVLTIDRVEKGFGCRMDSKRKILEALGLSLADRVRVFGEEE